jgi:hypothetical protein
VLRLSRRAANIWLAAVRLSIEGGTESVTGAPEHAALVNATLATVKPQREFVGHGFSRDHDDPRAGIGEIGEGGSSCVVRVSLDARWRWSPSIFTN